MCPVLFARLYWLVYLRLSSVIPQFLIPTVSVTVVVSSSVFSCFSLSQYPLPQCVFVWTWIDPRLFLDHDSCLPSLYLSPVIPGYDLRLPTDPTWISHDTTVCRLTTSGLSDYSVVF